MNTIAFPRIVFLFMLLPGVLSAEVSVPTLFSDHMVLQRAEKVPVWGKADPGEPVQVEFEGKSTSTTADGNGRWQVVLDLCKASREPSRMEIKGKNRIEINDVIVGEVWLASGQSNMAFQLRQTVDAAQEIANSASSGVRQFTVERASTAGPQEDCRGRWAVAAPETAGEFSAVAYHFAKALSRDLKTPVGIIHSSWGGSASEAWTSAEALNTVPELRRVLRLQKEAYAAFPNAKARFVKEFAAWLETENRQDRTAADPASFASPGLSLEDWVSVTLPGDVKGPGLSATGAIWLRQDVEVPSYAAGQALRVDIKAPEGYETIYWDADRIGGTTFKTDVGRGSLHRVYIPAKAVTPGRHTLAIRMYSPAAPLRLASAPHGNPVYLRNEWQAKNEYALPAKVSSPAPRAPKALPRAHMAAARVFNAMIHPLIPYALRGVIWYQGEANTGRAWQYRTAFPLLISDWRKQWGRDDLPFYFCQLPAFRRKQTDPGEASAWAELREAQSKALELPHTGQAVLLDVGEAKNIHPRLKKIPGERLARIAMAEAYNRAIPHSGPVYDSMKVEEGKVRLAFRHTEGGLKAEPLPDQYIVTSLAGKTAPLVRNSPGSELEGFAICGQDRQWVWADAKIDGETVVVWSDKVSEPVAVRYAWSDNPTANLFNGADLPASPFRTDDDPAVTRKNLYR